MDQKYSVVTLLKKITRQVRPFWAHLIGLFFLNILASPVTLLKPFALKIIIDSAFGSKPMPSFISFFFPSGFDFSFQAVLVTAVVFTLVIALFDNIIMAANWMLSAFAGEKIVLDFRTTLFNHIQRLSLAYHDSRGTSDALYKLQWDTMSIRTFLVSNLSPLLSSFLTLAAMIVVLFLINWQFALITICIIPPLYLLIRKSTKKLRHDWDIVKEDESKAISVIHEALGALRIVKAFGQERGEEEKYTLRADKAVRGQLKVARTGAIFYFVVGMLFAVATALFIYLGATLVKSGEITIGDLTLILAYLTQVFTPLQSISKNLNDIQSSLSSTERVFSLLDKEKEVWDDPNALRMTNSQGNFRFEEVSFAYENNKKILNEISFDIRSGDRIGIMGSTGAGKSTLVNLITRFYDPTSGNIFMDGVNIKNVRLEDYRNQFSIVLQEPVLFSASIGENIKYGLPGATDKEVIMAAKAANAHDFIMRCENGYDTLVGERGMKLSGGERQRIAIARAFIKNAPVLILDEPTSSLDVKTESQIMDAMEKLMEGRTSFMITHRLDTLKTCNGILHLERGSLIDFNRGISSDSIELKKKSFLADTSA